MAYILHLCLSLRTSWSLVNPLVMASLKLSEADIPELEGKTAIITGRINQDAERSMTLCTLTNEFAGGTSGIGLATAHILASKGAKTFLLDLFPLPDGEPAPQKATFIKCNAASWGDLRAAFAQAGKVDIAVANAGISEEQPYFVDEYDEAGQLLEPKFGVLDVNFKGVVMFVKLAVSYMRKQGSNGGSIVVTASATAYAPEQNLPVYSATKLGVSALLKKTSVWTDVPI